MKLAIFPCLTLLLCVIVAVGVIYKQFLAKPEEGVEENNFYPSFQLKNYE